MNIFLIVLAVLLYLCIGPFVLILMRAWMGEVDDFSCIVLWPIYMILFLLCLFINFFVDITGWIRGDYKK